MMRVLILVAAAAVLGSANRASAVATYGTPGAEAALRFDPYSAGAVPWTREAISPVVVPRAAALLAVSAAPEPRTPVDNPLPIVSVVDAPLVFEGPYLHDKPLYASFVVTLNKTSKKTVTVKYKTVNGSGRAGIEYKSTTGTVTFAPGQYSKVVNILILNDDLKVSTNVPGPRQFFLNIFQPTNAKLGRATGSARIAENGKLVEGVTVTNALPVLEAGKGLKALFTVTLNRSSPKTVTVSYKTRNGTALAGTDYAAKSGTLTFSPGQTVKTVSVDVFDNKPPNESLVEFFYLDLVSAKNALILRKTGIGEIVEYSPGF